MTLDEFNVADRDTAIAAARPCLDIPRWYEAVVDQRPYTNTAAIREQAYIAARPFSTAEIDGALVHHPRIGQRASGSGAEARMSAAEQANLGESSTDLEQALEAGNLDYEQRFGRVFLIRAAGRDRSEILTELRRRMDNSEATELDEIAGQLREIAITRLEGAITE
ncbi:2-oxo-4-hydroxy-4-carboxy-5-ureidoimidazoline decarboxylase [Salinisphaera sp. USBA-960]|uniref:2-oxo-4-hydroxy-4-carboxy-5-ureidoimidazoline decarboxylase n=1 Tax=Salinisphaera orenii TaxID=856731 RepID=UPI000DBE7518|nr:2-oxo-4-hydroxy-4-carboxy-5-ureidoimidazoline decarboxylase [Salifodinibacter halophilus]NNC26512.1 2-oxo-4-hydroxy-4-carboxy-5-ureidoimidazoline decarboxylase [Salifodinibacter halophilus]